MGMFNLPEEQRCSGRAFAMNYKLEERQFGMGGVGFCYIVYGCQVVDGFLWNSSLNPVVQLLGNRRLIMVYFVHAWHQRVVNSVNTVAFSLSLSLPLSLSPSLPPSLSPPVCHCSDPQACNDSIRRSVRELIMASSNPSH